MSNVSPRRGSLLNVMSSRFNFSFRKREKIAFRNIAHGLIPAATIAPRPAVPRTPPPRSPNPSPERPRSALAAAILSSSLTGRTIAIPPPRQRSYSESDCSRTDSQTGFEPFAATALYTRDRWTDSMTRRHPVPSPGHSDDDDEVEGLDFEEDHVYQSLERPSRADDNNAIYAVPLKLKKGVTSSEADEETEDSTFDIVSPLQTEEEIVVQDGVGQTQPSSPRQPRSISHGSMGSTDLNDDVTVQSQKSTLKNPKRKMSRRVRGKDREISSEVGAEAGKVLHCALDMQQSLVKELREQTQFLAKERERLEKRCLQQNLQIEKLQQELSQPHTQRGNFTGESLELLNLRQQAQELVDENDGLKMTVHRLNVELSRYQARFRPLAKDENSQLKGLPIKGPAPPWLVDIKYLSPLLLAYDDQLNARDKLFKSCEEELQSLKARAEKIIQENEKLHAQANKCTVSNKEWRQLQEQARLVLEENQVLMEQLELQHSKAKEAHSKHTHEVCKVTKQVMLLESEKHDLEKELDGEQKEHRALKTEFQRIRLAIENSLSLAEHIAETDKLKRELKEHEKGKNSEAEEMLVRMSALEAERKILLMDKANLSTSMKHIETELQLSQQTNRKAQRRISILKQQVEDSLEKELIAHQYLANIVTLAEKTTHERDQLMHMASSLEKDKQGVLTRIIGSTVRLGKLQEKVKVYKWQASASVCTLGRRLHEQEEDFAGKAASYQREIGHLQSQLKDRQEQLHGALQQKRVVEGELEVVWEATTRESQRLREVALRTSSLSAATMAPVLRNTFSQSPARIPSVEDHFFSTILPLFSTTQNGLPRPLHRSPMFESDSDQHQNPESSDENEKSRQD